MIATSGSFRLAAWLALGVVAGSAQPLARPLADFDKMVSELKTSSVVGEPIRAGDTTVIPFAAAQFGLGSAGAAVGSAAGMGLKTVPLGVVIVEGDEVRVESLPSNEAKAPGMMQQLIQAILDRKLSFMVNGLNLGSAPGNIADLTPLLKEMTGQTTVVVNGLNLGSLNAPRQAPTATPDPIADLEAAATRNPTAEAYFRLGEALRKSGRIEQSAAAYRKALELRPNYPEAAQALAELKK